MKALVYEKAHNLADFAIKLVEIPVPTPRENDVLVEVRAVDGIFGRWAGWAVGFG